MMLASLVWYAIVSANEVVSFLTFSDVLKLWLGIASPLELISMYTSLHTMSGFRRENLEYEKQRRKHGNQEQVFAAIKKIILDLLMNKVASFRVEFNVCQRNVPLFPPGLRQGKYTKIQSKGPTNIYKLRFVAILKNGCEEVLQFIGDARNKNKHRKYVLAKYVFQRVFGFVCMVRHTRANIPVVITGSATILDSDCRLFKQIASELGVPQWNARF